MLVILALAVFWYGIGPMAGALGSRRFWRQFRRRFNRLRLAPLIGYAAYRAAYGADEPDGTSAGIWRFIGTVEALTPDHVLWVQGNGLSIPVVLKGSHIYSLPAGDTSDTTTFHLDDQPQRIRWNQTAVFTEGTRVFAGGALCIRDGMGSFVSTRDQPLLVLFYDGDDRSIPVQVIRCGRNTHEFWNRCTPYCFILGAFCLLLMVLLFWDRPAFYVTGVTAFVAMGIPVLPFVPPGVLCTLAAQKLWQKGVFLRACRDVARIPLLYWAGEKRESRKTVSNGEKYGECRLPTGERYGGVFCLNPPQDIPLLAPETRQDTAEGWYVFGRLPNPWDTSPACLATPVSEPVLPVTEPADPFAPFVRIPVRVIRRRYTFTAHLAETAAIVCILLSILCNGVFIFYMVLLFRL